MPKRKLEVFNSEFSVLGIVQDGKLGVEKPWKTDSLSFPRTLSFGPC